MKHTDEIDDPTWHDIFDRDKEIKRLSVENETLRNRTEIFEDPDGLRKITGRGEFVLERTSLDRWIVKLNDERVELYNRKGRRVRGNLNHDGDW
jgi:hypothetical protein